MKPVSVLVVDDEEVIRNLVTQALVVEGYDVETAEDGPPALAWLGRRSFDILLTDLRMPQIDGLDLIREAARRDPTMAAVIMTAYAALETARAGITEGVYDYLVKPFSVSELQATIRRTLERRNRAVEAARLTTMRELFHVSERIATTLDQQHILRTILAAALGQTSAERGSVLLTDEDGKTLRIAAASGLEPEVISRGQRAVDEGVAAWVAREGKPLLVADMESHPSLQTFPRRYAGGSFVSVPIGPSPDSLIVPLHGPRRCLGVLNVSKKSDGSAFTESDLEFLTILATQAAIAVQNIHLSADLEEAYLNMLRSLSLLLESRDPYTHGHSSRVREYCRRLGQHLGLTGQEMTDLTNAAELHDLGKLAVSEAIFSKPGPLDEAERRVIQRHPVIADEVLRPLRFLNGARPIVKAHHERLDGRGYPDGLGGDQLNLQTRIIQVADAYDAMASDRPYRKALGLEAIRVQIMDHRGSQFDPAVADAFWSLLQQGALADIAEDARVH